MNRRDFLKQSAGLLVTLPALDSWGVVDGGETWTQTAKAPIQAGQWCMVEGDGLVYAKDSEPAWGVSVSQAKAGEMIKVLDFADLLKTH